MAIKFGNRLFYLICVLGFSIATQPIGWGEGRRGREKLICFKELAHMIVRAGGSEIHRAGWRPRKELCGSVSLKVARRQNSLFFGDRSLFLSRPLTNWMRLAHIIEDNQLYSESADLNLNLIFENYLHSNT